MPHLSSDSILKARNSVRQAKKLLIQDPSLAGPFYCVFGAMDDMLVFFDEGMD